MTRPLAEQQMKAELLAQGLKLCTKCQEIKSVDEFGPRPKNWDGLECWCKVCRCEYRHKWRQDNMERALARERAYFKMPKMQAYQREYKEANRERILEYHREYYQENREKELAAGHLRYEENKDKIQARAKVYRQEHKEERNKYNRRWRRRNPKKTKAYKTRYRRDNRERVLELDRLCSIRRRIKKAGADGFHTDEQWLQLLSFFNGICPCCGEEAELTQDHIIPIDWGGSNYLANLQPLCKGCNSKKKNYYAADYRPAHVRAWTWLQSFPQLESGVQWKIPWQVLERQQVSS